MWQVAARVAARTLVGSAYTIAGDKAAGIHIKRRKEKERLRLSASI